MSWFARLASRLPRPPRFSVKAMMGIVALAALTFVLATELINRQGRDRNAETEATNRRQVAWHQEQVGFCDQGQSLNRPYSFRDRVQVQRRGARSAGIEENSIPLTGWAAEKAAHLERIRLLTTEADEAARKKQYYQRRLLVPF